jgi:hypothetical protein
VSSNLVHGEVYSIQHYVIKFVSDLRQVDGFLRELRFPPPIKLTIYLNIVESGDYHLRHLVNNVAIYIDTHDYIRMEITVLYLKIS